MLNIVEQYTRVAMVTEVHGSLPSSNVIEVLNQLSRNYCEPSVIQTDNSLEFISHNLDAWAYRKNTCCDFSLPRKPNNNLFIELFIARFRMEFSIQISSNLLKTPRTP